MSNTNSTVALGNTKTKTTSKKQVSPAKNWCFTHNNYTDKDIEIYRSNKSVDCYVFQEETGAAGTKHLQGYLMFKTKQRPLSIFTNSKVHWEVCRDTEASIRYCSKDETRTGQIFTNIAGPRVDRELESFVPREWQQELHDYVTNNEPDRRTVRIYYDPVGGSGKSMFCKWMRMKYKNVLTISTNKSADILTAVKDHHKTCFIDLPKSKDGAFCPFNAVEQLKNGYVTEGKLKKELREVMWAPMHVIVFTNKMPDRQRLSEDRWEIFEFPGKDVEDENIREV